MKIKKPALRTVFWHIVIWSVYIFLEYLVNQVHLQSPDKLGLLITILKWMPVIILPSYFIILFVIPKYLNKRDKHLFVCWIVGIAVFIFFARIKWTEILIYLDDFRYYKIPASKVLKNLVRDYSIIALAVCISIISDWHNKQKLNAELLKARVEAEVKLLKGQLHPHFLFNSLNNIYSLAIMKSDQTAGSILKLTELLDFLLYKSDQERVLLTQEIQLLENYLELEKMRYDESLDLVWNKKLGNKDAYVMPLILLPFAENCFKHGGKNEHGKFILKIDLIQESNTLIFNISNSINQSKLRESENGGVGLENLKKRLDLYYPNEHELKIVSDGNIFTVNLVINLLSEKV